jgi:hypothetical protein
MGEDILPGDSADDLVVEERNGTLFDYAVDRQAEAAGSDREPVGSQAKAGRNGHARHYLMVSASGTAVKL